jgi:hypothetical protein
MEFTHLEEVLREYAERVKATYQDYLNSEGVNASGSLRDSISIGVDVDGHRYDVFLNLNKYWKWIEGGRPPTQNNGDGELRRAILDWIRVKPVLPTPINGKLPTEEQLAYLISRKIHQEGYEGKGLLKQSVNDNEEFLNVVQYAMLEDIERDINEVLILFK